MGQDLTPSSNAPGGLPPWSAALPLWAGSRWLWLVAEASGVVHHWQGAPGRILLKSYARSLREVRPAGRYPLVVLDCRALPELPAEWWPQLEGLLEPGGLLLVCHRHDERLVRGLSTHAPNLQPSGWHVIEPGQDGDWHLRPDTDQMREIAHDLHPPYSARVWLRRRLSRWLSPVGTKHCLPVWKGADG